MDQQHIKLKKDVGEKIIKEYNEKASAFDENTKNIEGVLNDSTAGLHDYLINKNYNKILENDKLFIEENKNTLKLFLAPSVWAVVIKKQKIRQKGFR